jgi:hypothetical protein
MTANYVLLEKITVGAAGASSVTFSGIPQTGYTDLVIKISTRDGGGFDDVYVTFNGSTTGYSNKLLFGTGASAGSSNPSGTGILFVANNGVSTTANTFANAEMYLPNYTSSNNKSASVDAVDENNATTAYAYLVGGLWANSAAITSISINAKSTTSFVQYSTFYLYGVAKLGTTPAIVPYATGGDTIMTDGTYWYHAFRSSGTFTPAKGLSCDVLVVAGGGGGSGGGAGAGGVFYATAQSLASGTGYTATIGAGGAGGSSVNVGSNSTFASLTAAIGGGAGGDYDGGAGTAGGSGGGRAGGSTSAGAASTQTSTGGTGYGNAGGAGFGSGGTRGSGAGGGAGGAGAAGTSATGGAGGAGNNTWSTWLNTTGTGVSGYIAGGGGGGAATTGGAAGSGGGGTGGSSSAGTAGTANTGGGGGGGFAVAGQSGGSGLVIVRYAV